MSNEKHFRENEGDAFGPGATLQSSEDGRISAAPPIAPAHTPGPWVVGSVRKYHQKEYVEILASDGLTPGAAPDYDVAWTRVHDARLIAAAPDHAIALRLLASGVAQWETWQDGVRGEFIIGGMRYVTKLDQFGCPELHDVIRAAISKATQQ